MGGVEGLKRICKELFTSFVNQLPKLDRNNPAYAADLRHRKGITPDLLLGLASIDLPENIDKAVAEFFLKIIAILFSPH